MKFLWQQVLGFLLVIIVALVIIASRMNTYMTEHLTLSRQEQLINYGKNIVNNNFSRADLYRASQVLASENILIQVFLPDGRIIYPTYDPKYNAELNQEDIDLLKTQNVLGFRQHETLNAKGEVETYLTIYLPHQDVGEFPNGFISLGAPLDDLQGQLNAVRQGIYGSFTIAIMIGIALSVAYALIQTRKIRSLQRASQEIALGNYHVEIDTSGIDEFGDLARDFKAMAHSLSESQEEIARQEELRRQFMMDVAHEMRTPLTTMSGILEGLQNNMIPENKQQRSLELVFKETQRLTRLVNENLDYEKIRSQQFTLKKEKINGKELLEAIQSTLSVKAKEKNNRLLLDLDEGLYFWADYDRLTQIIINLITNAIQFSENSTIQIVGRQLEKASQIKIIDQGIGMSAKDVKSIWERFYKADVSRKNTKFGESGIGLAVVHSLVEAHGGTIDVESQVGEGSIFTVTLPLKEEMNEEENLSHHRPSGR